MSLEAAPTTPPAPAATPVRPWLGFAAGAGAAIIWGIQSVVSRQSAADGLTSVDVTVLRFLTAAVVLLPFALMRLRPFPVGRIGWRKAMILTLFGGAPFAAVLVGGSAFAPALHTAVVAPGLIPVITGALAWLILGERTPAGRMVGLGLILAGIVVFAGPGLFGAGTEGAWRGDLFFATAALMWSIFSILAKRWEANALDLTITLSILSLVLLPLMSLAVPLRIGSAAFGPLALQALYQGLLVGVVSVFFYASANQILGAARATLFLPLVPAVAAISGALLIGEWPSVPEIAGMLLVMTGMTVALRS
ncbi:DMT family transporter [Phreatobacter sp.]|uniref:DMT family transporter n=1 Tax=Phreatobacter sp. TaxID=1966341 RepID=UPI003F6F93A3